MSYQIINETRLMVDQEINDFLMEYPQDHPFGMALSLPLFRQQLTAKILSKIPNRHQVYCNGASRSIAAGCLLGMIKERLLVEAEIHQLMPAMINDLKQPQSLAPAHPPLAGSRSFHIHEMAWWLRIHTMIPCVTYYFGPFDSREEAKQSYPAYVADLKQEKAIGISGQLQKTQPTLLTVMDSPDDLKRDQQQLWRSLHQYARRYKAALRGLHTFWHLLPGNFLLVNGDGTLKRANARAGQFLKTAAADLPGRSLFDYVPTSQIPVLKHCLAVMTQDPSPWSVPYRWSLQFRGAADTVIPVTVEVTQQRDATGKVIGWYWLLHELT
ncbi:MAG: DUF1816 domain-containing protein [Synechocystis sp.]|nr:DUF1816 domain-containing protein [Synechocystis sp.]